MSGFAFMPRLQSWNKRVVAHGWKSSDGAHERRDAEADNAASGFCCCAAESSRMARRRSWSAAATEGRREAATAIAGPATGRRNARRARFRYRHTLRGMHAARRIEGRRITGTQGDGFTMTAAYFIVPTLCAIALIHVYWACGGRVGKGAAIPELDGEPVLRPSAAGTFAVAAALLAGAGVIAARAGWLGASPHASAVAFATVALALIFAGRSATSATWVSSSTSADHDSRGWIRSAIRRCARRCRCRSRRCSGCADRCRACSLPRCGSGVRPA